MVQAKLQLLLELKNKLKAGLNQAKAQVGNELKGLKEQLTKFSHANSQAFEAISDQVPGLGRALSLLANPYALATAAAVGFVAYAGYATSEALAWEKSMAKVNVTAQKTPEALSQMSDEILRVAAYAEGDLKAVPDTFNTIISAGLSANESLEVLVPTLKAVKASFTDAKVVADAAVSVMNSSGEDINKVYDTLFATLNKGKAEFKDIAQYLPKVIPGARQAGFELYETAGAFAFLTAKGQTAEATTTGLMNVFKSFSDPRFIDGFKKIGVEVFDKKTGSARNMIDIIGDLQKSMAGLTDQQKAYKLDLVGLDRDAVGSFAIMTQNLEDLKMTIDATKNSQGALNQAYNDAKQSTDEWDLAMNKLQAVNIKFGQLFLPMVSTLGEYVNEIATDIFELVEGFQQLYKESDLLQSLWEYMKWALENPLRLIRLMYTITKSIWSFTGSMLLPVFEMIEDVWVRIRVVAGGVFEIFKDMFAIVQPIVEAFTNITDPAKVASSLLQAKKAWEDFDIGNSYERGKRRTDWEIKLAKAEAQHAKHGGSMTPDKKANPFDVAGAAAPAAEKVIGDSTTRKNITVNINALHQGDNIVNQVSGDKQLSTQDLEQQMTELLLRVIRNTEVSY